MDASGEVVRDLGVRSLFSFYFGEGGDLPVRI